MSITTPSCNNSGLRVSYGGSNRSPGSVTASICLDLLFSSIQNGCDCRIVDFLSDSLWTYFTFFHCLEAARVVWPPKEAKYFHFVRPAIFGVGTIGGTLTTNLAVLVILPFMHQCSLCPQFLICELTLCFCAHFLNCVHI